MNKFLKNKGGENIKLPVKNKKEKRFISSHTGGR
jgi:hypothetical protein